MLVLAAMLTGSCAVQQQILSPRTKPSALDAALETIFLDSSDLYAERDFALRDPFLKGVVYRSLIHPLHLVPCSRGMSDGFTAGSTSLAALVAQCSSLLEGAPGSGRRMPTEAPHLKDTVRYSPEHVLLQALIRSETLMDEAFSDLTEAELAMVQGRVERLLYAGLPEEGLSRKASNDAITETFSLAARIQDENIANACLLVASALDKTLPRLKREAGTMGEGTIETEAGSIVISGEGDDRHEGDMPLILIDKGGNDIYRFRSGRRTSIIIDLKGDDRYEAFSGSSLGAGIRGIGVLVDCAGNDVYQGNSCVFGCGLLGAGVIADYAGNDTYESGMMCQGAAAFGIGLLMDAAGDDTYRSILYAQGFGYVGGCGVLADFSGNDRFVSGTAVPDYREKSDAFQTYSQGFGLGCRLFASGGCGILFDGSGDDTYEGSYFCQGASYWRALGMLIDRRGADSYYSRRYSQGSGVHNGAGILFDAAGPDRYYSWGVTQGCGHDRAVGVLHDGGGDDLYAASWLGQGAGSAMGVGFLIDERGSDTYQAKAMASMCGSGSFDTRRDGVSLGVLVDAAGNDFFSIETNGAKLWERGFIGCGIDTDGLPALPLHVLQKKGSPPALSRGSYSPGATAGAVRPHRRLPQLEGPLLTEKAREEAAVSLAASGPDIMPLLCGYLSVKDVAVQRAVEETFVQLGRRDIESVHAFLFSGERLYDEKRLLLHVLGEIGSKSSNDILCSFVRSNRAGLQALALRGLYRIGEPPPVDTIRSLEKSENSGVRRYLCLALGTRPVQEGLAASCRLLNDNDYQVRHAAFAAIREAGLEAAPMLEAFMARGGMRPVVRRGAEALLQMIEKGRRETVKK